tara:strand:+ start:2127 stop:2567 length:441 start_codon:yes stop_codon:yes gene_type:complete
MAIDPFTLLAFGSKVVQAGAMASAGRAQRKAAELDAFNTETEKKRSKISALQRHNDRLELYRNNLATNIATFRGRDDASVRAFLNRQRDIALQDTSRSDLMGMFEQAKLQQQATTIRVEGRAREKAAKVKAFTTLMGGLMQFQDTM